MVIRKSYVKSSYHQRLPSSKQSSQGLPPLNGCWGHFVLTPILLAHLVRYLKPSLSVTICLIIANAQRRVPVSPQILTVSFLDLVQKELALG